MGGLNVYAASSDCVVVLVLGDLVAWGHFVRGLEGSDGGVGGPNVHAAPVIQV